MGELDLTRLLIYDIDNVEAAALPLLIDQFHLDEFVSDGATDNVLRGLIKQAIELHRYKGTPWAVRTALDIFGGGAKVVEWWQDAPQGTPYTFRVEMEVLDQGLDDAAWDAMLRVIEATKNVRSHLDALQLYLTTKSSIPAVGAATLCGEMIAVYPHSVTEVSTQTSVPVCGAALGGMETITVYPL